MQHVKGQKSENDAVVGHRLVSQMPDRSTGFLKVAHVTRKTDRTNYIDFLRDAYSLLDVPRELVKLLKELLKMSDLRLAANSTQSTLNL